MWTYYAHCKGNNQFQSRRQELICHTATVEDCKKIKSKKKKIKSFQVYHKSTSKIYYKKNKNERYSKGDN